MKIGNLLLTKRATRHAKKPTGRVTRRFPWHKLKRFVDWVLKREEWPTRLAAKAVKPSRKDARNLHKAVCLLEDISTRVADQAPAIAAKFLREYEQSMAWGYYRTPNALLPTDRRLGNIHVQEHIFVAKLGLQKLRESKVYQQSLCPTRDALRNMAYILEARLKKPWTKIHAALRQAYRRYLQKTDAADRNQVIDLLYDRYRSESHADLPSLEPSPYDRRLSNELREKYGVKVTPEELAGSSLRSVQSNMSLRRAIEARGAIVGGFHPPLLSEEERVMLDSLAKLASRESPVQGRRKQKLGSNLGAEPPLSGGTSKA